MSLAEWRSSWKYPTVILCVYGFFCSTRPSEPYLTPYLVGPDKNLTMEEVNNQIFPVWTYSYLVLLFPVFLATDYLRYKPLIVLQGTAFIVTWLLLLFAQGIMAMQVVEFTFGLSSATEVAYYSYIYSVVPSTKYQMVTGQCRSATLIGYTTGSVIGQILVSAAGVSYFILNIISMTCVSIAFLTSCLLPTPQHSMFFHRDLTANTVERKISVGQISIDNDIHSEKKNCQSNSSVCVSDIPKEFEPAEFVDLPLNPLPASAVVSPMVVFSHIWKDFLNCYKNKSLLLWSVWWALATCGYLQVINYVQTLWSTVEANATVYNGGVEAISTLTGVIMASSTLRSAPENWLIGKPNSRLSTARLPRGLDVLRLIQFHHLDEGRTLPASHKMACEAVVAVWERARIPTQRIDSCVRKVSKVYEKYLVLKKHRTRQQDSDKMKEEIFKGDLEELFDIATKDAMTEIKTAEDREFFQKQRKNVFSCSMSGADQNTFDKENRKRKRDEKERTANVRYKEREIKSIMGPIGELSVTSSSSESQSEDDYQPSASTPVAAAAPSPHMTPKNIFKSREVVGALDRVNLPDRGAVFVAAAGSK